MQLLQSVAVAQDLAGHGAGTQHVHMVRAHEVVGRAGTADGRQEAARLADAALTLVVVGEFKVLSLLLSDALKQIVVDRILVYR